MLELKNVDKVFNAGTANESLLFQDFSLKVAEGEFLSIVGSNGSGKTTLINMICGSVNPDSGEILSGGRDILKEPEHVRYRKVGRVYQDPAMGTCADMTVLENMSLADNKGRFYGLGQGTRKQRIGFYQENLARLGLGLEDKLGVRVGELSGGQRQAMALIMATMTPIEYLILDEHTAALDPRTAELIMELTDRLVKEKKLTTLMVTHNLNFALAYGSRILMLSQGRILLDQQGAAKDQLTMADLFAIY